MRAPVAVAYAVKHPDRVSRLLLLGGFHRAYCSAKNPDARVLEEADVPFAEEPAWHTFVAEARFAETSRQDEPQRVGAAARGVGLLPRGHV